MARKAVLVVVVFVGAFLSIYVLFGGQRQSAQAQGLDLDRHCRQHGKERAVNIDGTAYGWRCEDSQGQLHNISVQDACNEQYGPGYTAAYHSMDDPNSWYCAAPSPQPQPQDPPPAQPQPQPQDPPPAQPPPQPQKPPPAQNPPPQQPQIRHEGMDLDRYCREKGLGSIQLIGPHARDWKCLSGGTYHSLNLQELCMMQHGLTYVGLPNDDPNAWYCSNQPENVADGSESPLPNSGEPHVQVGQDAGPAFASSLMAEKWSGGGCRITAFTMSPKGPYVYGDHVQLRVESTCGTVKFNVDGRSKAEIGSTSQTETWKTNETSVGRVQVCALARGTGGWDNGPKVCYEVYVGNQSRVDAYRPGGSNSGVSGSSSSNSCPAASTKLSVGQLAVIGVDTLNVRSSAGLNAGVQRKLNKGNVVSIISGPQCHDNYRWWEIGDSGWAGWAAEVGSNGEYYLLPNGSPLTGPSSGGDSSGSSGSSGMGSGSGSSSQPQPPDSSQCYKAMDPLFTVGDRGQVAIKDGTGSMIQIGPAEVPDLLYLEEGEQFTVAGGPTCAIGFRWWQVMAQGVTGWIAEGDEHGYWLGVLQESPNTIESYSFHYSPFGQTYNLMVDQQCIVVNGAEVVAQEINRAYGWADDLYRQNPTLTADGDLYLYIKNDGGIDTFRVSLEAFLVRETGCMSFSYQLTNSATMDSYGLGNILYGYFSVLLPDRAAHSIADFLQRREEGQPDPPDDVSQIDLGRAIANSGSHVDVDLVRSLIPEGFNSSR